MRENPEATAKELFDEEIQRWWMAHEVIDNKRIQREEEAMNAAREADRKMAIRRRVISQLTEEEREVLGL